MNHQHPAPSAEDSLLLHATCVALEGRAVLLRGPSGSGKSDLALRLIDAGALLVADDLVGVLRHVLHSRQQRLEGEFVLPADSAPQLNDAPGLSVLASEVATADAFMICVLDEGNAVVQRYCQSVQAGELEPAAITLPPMFDIDV